MIRSSRPAPFFRRLKLARRARTLGLWMTLTPAAGHAASNPLDRVAIQTDAPTARAGQPVDLRIVNIDAAAAPQASEASWEALRPTRLFARNEGSQENRDAVTPVAGSASLTRVTLSESGAALIGVEFAPRIEVVAVDVLRQATNQRLAESQRKALDAATPAGNVRVRLVQSAATLARVVGDSSGRPRASPTAVSKSGLRVEIRPLMDPSLIEAGTDLAIRLYVDGDKRADATVVAVHVASGARQVITPNSTAIANISIAQAGRWRLEMSAFDRGQAGGDADWTLFSSTLTFDVSDAEAKP